MRKYYDEDLLHSIEVIDNRDVDIGFATELHRVSIGQRTNLRDDSELTKQ